MPHERSHAMITVAIGTMDRPEPLARAVDAILAGRTLPAELVIVDQSVGDGTARLVGGSRWSSVVTVRYIRQTRRGLSVSRNAAIASATQPIVAFTDDDCVPDPEWLAGITAGFDGDERPDAVTGRVLPLGPEHPGLYAVSTRASANRAVYRGRALPWPVGSGGNAAVRREWLHRIGGFDERLGTGSPGRSAEDLDLFYRLLEAGATIRYEPASIVFHERQSAERRRASRPSYGFGLGAFCAFRARRGDAYALWMLGRWTLDRGHALLRACVRCRWRRIGEELLMLQGATRGVAHGLHLEVHR